MYIFVPNEDEVAHPKWGPGHLTSASGAWCGWGEGQLEDEIDRGVWGCVELSNEEMDRLLRLPQREMFPSLVRRACPLTDLSSEPPPASRKAS